MDFSSALVLGGNGYIGSAVAAFLAARDLAIKAVDIGIRGNGLSAPTERRHLQDLRPEELSDFDTIILLAGHSSVAGCDRWPSQSFANNVTAFVELVHKLRGQKLIFASTSSVYVNTGQSLASEDDPLPKPVCYYDFHKQFIDSYAALAYPNSFGLRFGTVCGPSANFRKDVLLNSMVWSALHEHRVDVANSDYHRPLLGIFDLCRAIEAIIKCPPPPGSYNLASVNVRIGDVADYVARRYAVPCFQVERPTRYDIQMSSKRFSQLSGMEFRDTLPSLVDALETFLAKNQGPWSPTDGL